MSTRGRPTVRLVFTLLLGISRIRINARLRSLVVSQLQTQRLFLLPVSQKLLEPSLKLTGETPKAVRNWGSICL